MASKRLWSSSAGSALTIVGDCDAIETEPIEEWVIVNRDNQLEAPFLARVTALRETIRHARRYTCDKTWAEAGSWAWDGPELRRHGVAFVREQECEDLDRLVRDTNRLRDRIADLAQAYRRDKVTALDRRAKDGPNEAIALADLRKMVRAEVDQQLTPVLATFLEALQHVRRNAASAAPRPNGSAHVIDADEVDLPAFLKAPIDRDEGLDASSDKTEGPRRRWR